MLVYIHGGIMILGVVLMTAGLVLARFFRRRRGWLRLHRALGIAGSVAVAGGFVVAIAMVTLAGGTHFGVLHGKMGALAVFMTTLTPVLGQLTIAIPTRAARIRPYHRRGGYITLVLVLMMVVSGLSLVGVIPTFGP
ncbi:MAG: hypothetical protein N2Z74_09090 [Syntrophales bacterium]|nr:hypothetical protein [Syntrophales bacterium]